MTSFIFSIESNVYRRNIEDLDVSFGNALISRQFNDFINNCNRFIESELRVLCNGEYKGWKSIKKLCGRQNKYQCYYEFLLEIQNTLRPLHNAYNNIKRGNAIYRGNSTHIIGSDDSDSISISDLFNAIRTLTINHYPRICVMNGNI